MKNKFLFFSEDLSDNSVFQLDEDESKHCTKILRFKINDTIFVTNGKGIIVEAQIVSIDKKIVTVSPVKVFHYSEPQKFKYHVAISLLKHKERFEWFVEKATELGVSSITPLICEKTEKVSLKIDRIRKIAIEAVKQSFQAQLPQINNPVKLIDFISNCDNQVKLIANCSFDNNNLINNEINLLNNDFVCLIGPEADFTQKEIEIAIKHNFIPVTFGTTRLRSETAAIYACSIFNFVSQNVK